MQIQLLTPENGQTLHQLWLRGVHDHPEAFGSTGEEHQRVHPGEFVERNTTAPDRFFLLGAFVDGELIGFAGMGRELREKLRHTATLGPVYVISEMRGRGIGRALVHEAILRARAWPGLAQVKLSVAVGNTPARELYRAYGFVPYGVEPRGMKVGDRYIDMELLCLQF